MQIRQSLLLLSLVLAVSPARSARSPFGRQQWTDTDSSAPVASNPRTGSKGSHGTAVTYDPSTPGDGYPSGGSADAGNGGSSVPDGSTTSGASSPGGPYDGREYKGQATTYASSWSIGNCLLSKWPQPKGLGPIAIAQNLWDSSRMCGACVSITSSFGTHLGIITDQSDVKPNSLDLGPDVWSQVSNHQKSSAIPITWNLVPCNFTAPIQFYNKNGVNPYYTAIQVAGANKPIKSLEARSTDVKNYGGGAESDGWIKLVRQSNSNHFGPPSGQRGLGASADLRVTCDDGKQIVTKGVNLLNSSKPTAASGNC
ncbi:hypothetical protein PCANC_02964 [Puccinia coronata f. sp. avenae]|uniref:Expansin-like EG45 domain-containing protein n=1 Tax=Puccinia coronata f. sp. avenae TaxID=200324 RepID=A0A2N5SZD1_9BASI|nr:hypothetical protein PCASD_20483 [Puccinia coronata f. sp. avenae]PLW18606.1 hypothetical protein PCANC_09196 [Puccinia coronata f. sp. avenae]PLW55995.1 hypothetical protein PCANC_02964 [Puccinia coronata f. sp. avenae]